MAGKERNRRTAVRGLGWALLALFLAGPSSAAPAGDSYLDTGEAVARGKALAADVVFIGDRGHVSVFELSGNYDKELADGTVNVEPRRDVAGRFFEAHPDSYDFLIVFTTFEFESGEDVKAFYLGVRNDTLGIGQPIFDQSDLYGSAGRLQGYIDMAALTRYELNPLEPDFDFTLGTAAHEIMHRWGVRIDGPLGDRLLRSTDRAHWSFLVDTDGSLMYGNDWRPNGDGTFTSVAIRSFYNPVELYLAGFYGPEEVPPFFVIDDPLVDPDALPELGAVVEGPAETITIDDILAANGPRTPAAADSQHEFRAAFLLLKAPGETVSDQVLASLERVRQELMTRLPILTGGRGLIEVEPQVVTGLGPGSPEPVEGGDPRVGDASLADALAWLRAEQAGEGYWQDTPATRQRDTSTVVAVLDAYDPSFAGLGAALAWLGAEPNANTDALAHAATTFRRFGGATTALQGEIAALQNADGGWGLGADRGSNPLDTALASAALSGPETALAKAVAYLVSAQNPDGGWGNHVGGSSRTGVTTTVAELLAARADVPGDVLAGAATWLAAKQNADGGFGDSPSTAHDTANVLLALLTLDATEAIDRAAATGFLRGRQGEDGSWAGSRYATALAVDALKRAEGLPNFSFAAPLVAEPPDPRDGERVRLTATVTNNGGEPTLPGILRFYDGDPLAGGVLFDEVELPSLARHAQATATTYWESFDRPGPWVLYAVLDPDGAVVELSEADNTTSIGIEVSPAGEGVDLVVADFSVLPAAPDTLPVQLAVSAVARNAGKTDAGSVTAALWLGEPASGTLIDTTELVLHERSSAVANFVATLTEPGATLLTVELDPDGVVAEDDETNNTATVLVEPLANVDVEVTDSDLHLVEAAAVLGHDVTFRISLNNRGTLDLGEPLAVRVAIADGVGEEEILTTSLPLAAGESATLDAPWRVDRLGDLELVVVLDPLGRIPESDESNNVARLALTAVEPYGANLSVSHEDLTLAPSPASVGALVTLSLLVRNTGAQALADVAVDFYDGDPAAMGVLIERVLIPSLDAGGSAQATASFGPIPAAADHLIVAVVDPDDSVAEEDEADNTAFQTLPVLALPDLAVSATAVTTDPPFPSPGGSVTITAVVANLGATVVEGAVVRLSESGATIGEQLVSVGSGATVTAVFAWTLPPSGETRTLRLDVDPGDVVGESLETNNTAYFQVVPRTADQRLSNRVFSPDGDGVRDTTVFFLDLSVPLPEVVVEVLDASGRPVRREAVALDGTTGSFEWDGRDGTGVVVADGEYRLTALGPDSGVLAAAPVTVDTNRSPLFAAEGTAYESFTNLTCQSENPVDLLLPEPYSRAFFRNSQGFYTQVPGQVEGELIFPQSSSFNLAVSDDREKLAVGWYSSGYYWMRHANADGSDVGTPIRNVQSFGFRPGTQSLVYGEGSSLRERPLDGSGPERLIATLSGILYFSHDGFEDGFSPDGGKLLTRAGSWRTGYPYYLVDLDSGEAIQLAEPSWINLSEDFRLAWSPDGSLFAVTWIWYGPNDEEGRQAKIGIYRRDGTFLRAIPLPHQGIAEIFDQEEIVALGPAPNPNDLNLESVMQPSWSSSGDQLVIGTQYSEGSGLPPQFDALFGRLFRVDVHTGEVETIAVLEPEIDIWSYHVSTWDGTSWVERGRLHYGNLYGEQVLDLSGHLPDADGEYKVRIRQAGKDAAHVERIALRIGAGGAVLELAPDEATVAGEDVLPLVGRLDHEVLDLYEREMELAWRPDGTVPEDAPVGIALLAREESFKSLRVGPFSYPSDPKAAYDFVVTGDGGFLVDGFQDVGGGLGEPLFVEVSRPGTGHPTARVYGYATSDGEYLYAALDFTVDNTLDGDKDWGAVLVETSQGFREYRVSVAETEHGAVGFTYTDKVPYRHKYYELKVPLAELGATVGDTLRLRFMAYGTAGKPYDLWEDDFEMGLMPLWGYYPRWMPGTDQVLYTQSWSGSTWLIDLDRGNQVRRVLRDFDTLGYPFVVGSDKLVFRDDRDAADPQSECYQGGGASYFLFESLANLTAKLRIRPADDGVGLVLEGIAADLNFSHYRLEYADEALPGFWTPIGPDYESQVIEDVFTTWSPPYPANFLVRLTVFDRAGNSRHAVERVEGLFVTEPLSVTDVSLSPRFISPNGDGVQDAAVLRYTVREPVHLEIGIWNDRPEQVRTIRLDHFDVDEEHTFLWDGRDDQGLPVPDGNYTLKLLHYRLPVTVDRTAPHARVGRPTVTVEEKGHILFKPQVFRCLEDLNPVEGVLEVGEGANPSSWQEVARLGPVNCVPQDFMALSLEEVVHRRYRLRAHDAAGNATVVTGELAVEGLHLLAYRKASEESLLPVPIEGAALPVPMDLYGPLRLALAETAKLGLVSVTLELFQPSYGVWQAVPVDGYFVAEGSLPLPTVPAGRFELLWSDPSLVRLGEPLTLRIRAVDEAGHDFVSNAFAMSPRGLVNKGLLRTEELTSEQMRQLEELDIDEKTVFWAEAWTETPLVDPKLLVTSDEDPRYADGKILELAGAIDHFLFFATSELEGCKLYQSVVSASRATADGTLVPVISNVAPAALPCIEVNASRQSVESDCNELATSASFKLVPASLDGSQLHLLSLALGDPENVIYTVNAPGSRTPYVYELDTTDLPEGTYELYVRLTNVKSEEASKRLTFYVDHTMPQIVLTYPLPGEPTCGGLEGTLTDPGPFTYGIQKLDEPSGLWEPFAGTESGTDLVSGQLATLDGVDGDVRIRVGVRDRGFNQACEERQLLLDTAVAAPRVSADRKVFSPNGDGLSDQVSFAIEAAEPVTVEADLGKASFVAGEWVVDGPLLGRFLEPLTMDGSTVVAWDGRLGGTVVADGPYLMVFSYRDACGNTSSRQVLLIVDTAPPDLAILSPGAGETVGVFVDVWGSVLDNHLETYSLEVGAGSDPLVWNPLASDRGNRLNELLFTWNSFGFQGLHTLRLRAVDAVGNAAEVRQAIELVHPVEIVSSFEVVPDLISPNGDGRRDAAALSFFLTIDSLLTLEVVTVGDVPVRTLLVDELTTAGSGLRTWDGRDDAGQAVADGTYRARLRAVSAEDAAVEQVERVSLRVDTTPPAVALSRPAAGFTSGDGEVVGTITDLHFERYRLDLATDPAASQWQLLATGTEPLVDAPLGHLGGLAEGDFALRLEASDRAGNQVDQVFHFTVDNSAPAVRLDSPAAGAVLTAGRGPVLVNGSVEEKYLASYRLEVGAGATPSSWVQIAAGSNLPSAPITSWDVSGLADGPYVLRLVATDLAGLEGVAEAAVTVDNTPPVAVITQPVSGGYITAPTSVLGTASDERFEQYRFDIAPGPPATAAQWSELARLASPVVDATLLDWRSLPADGLYTLRLTVRDTAGNEAATTVEVHVDTTPPGAPQGLVAALENDNFDARLTWQPNPEGDVAGYHVYRDGERITAEPLPAPSYVDASVPEGSTSYTVTAVDEAGHESPASGPAAVTVDRTPPTARIHQPKDGERVRGLVAARLTAYSADDFAKSRLVAVPDGGGEQVVYAATVPVLSQTVAPWDSTALPEDAGVVLRLSAEDVRGNVATHEVRVTVDNLAPAPPTGLTAVAAGADVALAWNANVEADLRGYLLYRGGRLVNGVGVTIDDLRDFALTATSYGDLDVADGDYAYTVVAIDLAGNVSLPSAPATVAIDVRAPRATIVDPQDGSAVDRSVYLLAATVDRDVVQVRFEAAASGGAAWNEIATDLAAPWEAYWAPTALPYGTYRIRAVATDASQKSDPAPVPITLVYKELERPAPVAGLVAATEGGTVTLHWTPNGEEDLAGYHVERKSSSGSILRLTATPTPAATYVDSGLPDADYEYVVVAVDTSDNEADPSAPAAAAVYTPVLEGIPSFLLVSEVEVAGVAALVSGAPVAGATVTVTVTPGGAAPLTATTGDDGTFSLSHVPLSAGDNTIAAVVRDAAGNASKPATANVRTVFPPSVPTGLDGAFQDPDVELAWNPNPEPDVATYHVYRDGNLLSTPEALTGLTASASSEYSSSYNASKALVASGYWSPWNDSTHPIAGQWWQASWSGQRLISELRLRWASGPGVEAVDFDIEVWYRDAWTTALEVRDNVEWDLRVSLPGIFPTTRVRIVIYTFAGDPEWIRPLQLSLVEVFALPVLSTAYVDLSPPEGLRDYQVSAVNAYGLESPLSDIAEVGVGDYVPPDPVALGAMVTLSDVALSWTPSLAPDLSYYEIHRDGVAIGWSAAPLYTDADLPNGTYRYLVYALDETGNRSAPSNEVTVTVAVQPPPAPVQLTVTAPPRGAALELAWQAGSAEAPAAYSVLRSITAGGPYLVVAQVAAAGYVDEGLTNGVTYFYLVRALDANGNTSGDSEEKSGTPQDLEGPAAPVLTQPGAPGAPYVYDGRTLPLLAGLAEPGSVVTAYRDGLQIGTVATLEERTKDVVPDSPSSFYSWRWASPSPDGRWAWIHAWGSYFWIYDFSTGNLTDAPYDAEAEFYPSSEKVVLSTNPIRTYNLLDGTVEQIATIDSVSAAVPSPDGRYLAVVGVKDSLEGIYSADLVTGTWTRLVSTMYRVNLRSVRWSSDSRHFAYSRNTLVEVADVETGAVWEVTHAGVSWLTLDWSADGTTLAYCAADAAGWYQVRLYHLADGTDEALTSEPSDHYLPSWSAFGELTYVVDEERVVSHNLATGEVEVLYELVDWDWTSAARPSGYLLLMDGGVIFRLSPKGRFELPDVPLSLGENRFTARARDAAGNQSPPSEEKVVVVQAVSSPDLELNREDVVVLPAFPVAGESVRLSVTVHNTGTVAAAATELKLALIGPDGSIAQLGLFPVQALAPGGLDAVTIDFSPGAGAGSYEVAAVVDPFDRVAETREDNNQARQPIHVLAQTGPGVFVATDADTYSGDEDVTVTVVAVNGEPRVLGGLLNVVVEDGDGYLVSSLLDADPVALAAGESRTSELVWNTGATFSGAYRVRATLVEEGLAVAEAVTAFEILPDALVEAAVTTDRTQYDEGETVRITGSVSYVSGNRLLTDAVAYLRLVGANGEVLAEWNRPIGDLLPATDSTVRADWSSVGAPSSFYQAELEIYVGEDFLASDETVFALGNVGPAELVASKDDVLAVDADGDGVSGPGDTLRYEIAVTNVGGQPASEVKLTDLVPQGTAMVAASLTTTHGDALSEDPVEVSIGTLGSGETATVTFEVTIDDPLPEGLTQIENQGTVTSAEQPAVLTDDPDLGGDADKTVTSVGGAPELVAEMTWTLGGDTDEDGVASPGDTLSYAVSVKNLGSGPATGVGFGAEIPQHTSLVAGSVQTDVGTVETESPILVVLGDLDAGAEATITFDVTIDNPVAAGVHEITNQGLVVSDPLEDLLTDDPTVGGEADPTVTAIAAAPDLTVEKTATLFSDADGDGLASPGDEILYRVEVENTGNTAATGVQLDDPVGAYLAVVAESVQSSHGTVLGESPVAVEIGEVAVGEPAVVTFRVTIDDPFPVDVLEVANQASVDSAELESIASDDPWTPESSDPTVTPVYITPDVTLNDAMAGEETGAAVVAVTLSEPGNRPVTLTFATTSGTALAGYDYEEASADLEIVAGETAAEISVTLLDDALDEDDEMLTVTLTEAQGANVADGEATVTIVDDDPPPVLTMSDVSVDEGAGSAAFVLSLSTESSREIRVEASTADGTAVAGLDYTGTSQSVLFPAGSLGAQVNVAVTDDIVDELDETFELRLYDPQNVVLGGATAVATIVDDDEALVSIDDVETDEGDGGTAHDAVFTVELATLSDREITVDYSTADGTAAEGREYEAVTGTLTFAPGEVRSEIAVPILGDTILEDGDKTFQVELGNAVNTTIEDGVGVCTIHDDEVCPGPELLVNPGAEARVRDGVIPGWTPLLGDDWQVSGADPEPYEGTAYFDAGQSEMAELYQDVDVRAYDARIATGGQLFAFSGRVRTRDETPPDVAQIVVEYRDASNAAVLEAFSSGEIANPYEWQEVADVRAAPVGTGWIRVRLLATRFTDEWNDGYFDALALASRRTAVVTIDDVEVYEGHTGTTDAVFTVALSCPYEHEVAGTFATAEGTALAGEDYLAVEGGFSIPAGETDFEITVPVVADEEDEEPVESFTVELGELQSDGSPVLLDGSGRGDIKNDDFCPLSPGYWKNHREDWVVEELRIGGVWYDEVAMMEHLRYGGPDASSRLARHLVATLLNLARGSDPFILPAVEAADAFLAIFPPESDPRGEDRDEANRIKDLLDDYNNLPCEDDGGGGGNGNGNGKGGR